LNTNEIEIGVRLLCPLERAFQMFTDNKLLESWLTVHAEVDPVQGGRFELFWNPDDRQNDSTIGCKITAIEPNRFLSFTWKGPKEFKHFMNDAVPLTEVVVMFWEFADLGRKATDVRLIHFGWRSSVEWQETRKYFERNWRVAFEKLREVA